MIINHNIEAMFAHRQMKTNNIDYTKSIEKLSSGLRINRAGDDASGLAVSEKMRAQIRGLKQAQRNTEDGISFIQTTEGYMQSTQNILQRIRELSVQASNGIYTAEDRLQIQVEVSQLIDEIDRIASHAQFNGLNMLTGRYSDPKAVGEEFGSLWIHLGPNMDQRERFFVGTMTSASLGLKNTTTHSIISISAPNKANAVIGTIDQALSKVSKQRATLGAYQNRLEFASKAIHIGYENLQASESQIRDADMAQESIKFSKNQILMQTANAMLAQANTRPQMVLQLIR